jgi:hypothetical protein
VDSSTGRVANGVCPAPDFVLEACHRLAEVVLDVECLAGLLGRLALDHVGSGLAAGVKEGLDIHVVGGEDDLEQHLLVDLHELLVPLLDVGGLLASAV